MKIAVLGAGMVGRTIASDLSKDFEVASFDRDENNLQILSSETNVRCIATDLSNHANFGVLLKKYDLIVSAVPGFMGYKTLEAIINCGKNVADISFFSEDASALHELAVQKNVTAIVDCGVAPGMSNFILGYHNSLMKIESFECMVGGLPKKRVKPFEYKAPFSPIDVIEEYTRPARYVENGFVVTKPALSDAELINFEHAGTLESFNTDGLRSILFTMKHIPNMKEKTLRYPSHISLIQALMQAGFFNKEEIIVKGKTVRPIDVTSAILFEQWRPEVGGEEFTIMKIIIKGTEKDKQKNIEYLLYDEYDAPTQNPSMSRTTGYACNAFANLIINKKFQKKGVFPPELIGNDIACFSYVMNYLKERGIEYKRS